MTSSNLPPQFGRYEVRRLLGRGAVGEVYLAEDPALSRKVAVKTLSGLEGLPASEQDETRARFLREARAAAALGHPNIVTIYDVGEQAGLPYIAMEYLKGTTLDRYAREGHLLPTPKVLEIGIHAALALDEAHRAAIIHRDIKPSNMVLLEDGTLKVADFGLAKDVRTSLTSTQTLLGTPNYMAPEQVAGRAVDGRADLFSLAVSLFELLTGQRPFSGDTVSSVLYRIVNDPPVPIADLRDDLPEDLQRFFQSALSKEPADRPATGKEFAKLLHRILVGMGGVPDNMTLPAPAARRSESGTAPAAASTSAIAPSKPARRRRGLRVVLGVLVLVALCVGAWTMPLWLGQDPLGDRRRPFEDWLSATLGGVGDFVRITAKERVVPVATIPAGLAVVVGSEDVSLDDQGRLRFPQDRDAPIILRVDDPCREGEVELDPRTIEAPVLVETRPKTRSFRVDSEPSGARIRVDAQRIEGTTPTDVALELCRDHSLVFEVSGRRPSELDLSGDDDVASWEEQLSSVSLSSRLLGTLVVSKSADYPVVILDRRGRRIGRAGQRIRLTPGRHRLVLSSQEVLYRREIEVRVETDQQSREEIVYPALGTLRVFSIPGDAKVTIRPAGGGSSLDVGSTPITGYSAVAGRHEVTVEHPSTGQRAVKSVTVAAGEGTTDVRVGKGDWQ